MCFRDLHLLLQGFRFCLILHIGPVLPCSSDNSTVPALALLFPFNIISNTNYVPIKFNFLCVFHSQFSISWAKRWHFMKWKLVVPSHCKSENGNGLSWLNFYVVCCAMPSIAHHQASEREEYWVIQQITMLCGTECRTTLPQSFPLLCDIKSFYLIITNH